jgi:hypothetical protein
MLKSFHSWYQFGNYLLAGCLAIFNVFHIKFWRMVLATFRLKYISNISSYICFLAGFELKNSELETIYWSSGSASSVHGWGNWLRRVLGLTVWGVAKSWSFEVGGSSSLNSALPLLSHEPLRKLYKLSTNLIWKVGIEIYWLIRSLK